MHCLDLQMLQTAERKTQPKFSTSLPTVPLFLLSQTTLGPYMRLNMFSPCEIELLGFCTWFRFTISCLWVKIEIGVKMWLS